jgi:hypothetical protein
MERMECDLIGFAINKAKISPEDRFTVALKIIDEFRSHNIKFDDERRFMYAATRDRTLLAGQTNENGECPSGLAIQHDGISCTTAHPDI